MVLGGLTNKLSKTDLGRSIIKRFGGAVQGAGQGFMKDPKPKTRTEPDDSWLDNYRSN